MNEGKHSADQPVGVLPAGPASEAMPAETTSAALEFEREKARLIFVSERMLILQRSVLEYAQIAIRTVILANGVTATAILAYLGEHGSTLPTSSVRGLALAVVTAALGVAAGFLATIFAYLSQWQIARREARTMVLEEPGKRWERTAGLICIFVGLFAFLLSVGVAALSYTRFLR